MRAKAHVHAIDGAFGSRLGDEVQDFLREAREVLGVCGFALRAAGGVAGLAVEEKEIDVGIVVEFLAAEFAERENGHARGVGAAFRIGELRRAVIVFDAKRGHEEGAFEENVG